MVQHFEDFIVALEEGEEEGEEEGAIIEDEGTFFEQGAIAAVL